MSNWSQLIKAEWRLLGAEEFHKVVLRDLLRDFFDPWDYKKMVMTRSRANNTYILKDNTIFYNPGPLDADQAVKEIFGSVSEMLKMQGRTCLELMDYIDQVETTDGSKRNPPKQFFSNFANSCAPDSILFILFFCDHSYFMSCIDNSSIEKSENKKLALELKPALMSLYASGAWTGSIVNIQKILASYLEGGAVCNVKSGTEIWGVLSKAYTLLQFPVLTRHMKEIKNTTFMASYLPFEKEFLPEMLVNAPPHIIYADDDAGKRNLKEIGFAMEHKVALEMGDGLGEKSVSYKLDAVLFFMNGHYTCALRTRKNWWYYDDVAGIGVGGGGSNVKILKNPESGIFNETTNKKTQVLFYSKVVEF